VGESKVDKEKLTRGGRGPQGLAQDNVDLVIDGETVTVRVRAMNRGELLYGGKLNDSKGQLEMEAYILSSCLIDPEMSMEDVAAWQSSGGAMECQPAVLKIQQLSGVSKEAAKSDVPGDGEDRS
jgi:hypothetical protein